MNALSPKSTQARGILAAIDLLKVAGIVAELKLLPVPADGPGPAVERPVLIFRLHPIAPWSDLARLGWMHRASGAVSLLCASGMLGSLQVVPLTPDDGWPAELHPCIVLRSQCGDTHADRAPLLEAVAAVWTYQAQAIHADTALRRARGTA